MTYPKMASFYFKAASEQDEEKQVERMQQALRLTDEEWRYIVRLPPTNTIAMKTRPRSPR